MRARLTELRRTGKEEAALPVPPTTKPVKKDSGKGKSEPAKLVGLELDLRGERAEDALDRLDRYLTDAFSSGLPFVRIIHGKGTGRLRQVIREALKQSSMISRFDSGMDNEGGEGVTVAHIKLE
jgi:DNA mismatch repair protein MutS2